MKMVKYIITLLLATLIFCLAAANVSAGKAADLTIAFSSNVNGQLEPCG